MSADESSVEPIEPHTYLSTACFHKLHEKCRRWCKWCETKCVCSCHPEKDATSDA